MKFAAGHDKIVATLPRLSGLKLPKMVKNFEHDGEQFWYFDQGRFTIVPDQLVVRIDGERFYCFGLSREGRRSVWRKWMFRYDSTLKNYSDPVEVFSEYSFDVSRFGIDPHPTEALMASLPD